MKETQIKKEINEPNYKALYEQVHKKYGDAVERMKSWMNGEHPECFSEAQKAAEFVFPELAENGSEDEKLRIQLLNWFKSCNWEAIDNGTLRKVDIIAWLEKQGEKKEM